MTAATPNADRLAEQAEEARRSIVPGWKLEADDWSAGYEEGHQHGTRAGELRQLIRCRRCEGYQAELQRLDAEPAAELRHRNSSLVRECAALTKSEKEAWDAAMKLDMQVALSSFSVSCCGASRVRMHCAI